MKVLLRNALSGAVFPLFLLRVMYQRNHILGHIAVWLADFVILPTDVTMKVRAH